MNCKRCGNEIIDDGDAYIPEPLTLCIQCKSDDIWNYIAKVKQEVEAWPGWKKERWDMRVA